MLEILRSLHIELPVVGAQMAGFALLYVLLRLYLFGPLGRIAAERSQQITHDLDSARERGEEAERFRQELASRLDGIEEDARQRLQQAVREAEAARATLLQEARAEGDRLRSRAARDIELARDQAFEELRSGVADLALLAAGQALRTTLDETAQRRAVEDFIQQVEQLPPRRYH